MLTYSFAARKKEPLYEQLYHFIRQDILAGQLRPGEKLPSKRSLAQHLGISTITVEGAYGQLTAEGYCYTQPKRGFFVSSLEGIGEKKRPVQVRKTVSRPEPVRYLADFAANSVNPADFPFQIWTKMLREVVADEAKALLNRSPSGGVAALREAIAEHLQHFRTHVGADVLRIQVRGRLCRREVRRLRRDAPQPHRSSGLIRTRTQDGLTS